MSTLLYYHPAFLEHDTGHDHPECADRLRAIMRVLEGEEFSFLHRVTPPKATLEQIQLQHKRFYVETILERVPETGYYYVDGDTVLSPGSGEAALLAVGAVCDAVDNVLTGGARNAFCAIRPPGHHAERESGMGFCLFNNVAIGAEWARKKHGIDRVAIIDFDVHHGNGTQEMVDRNAGIMYCSTHQLPGYPGTGLAHETGIANNIVNVAMEPGSGSEVFREAFIGRILPALRDFKPELVMISAGFDAHARDPLAHCRLMTEDYDWVTRELLAVADECCKGRVVSALEGGYDLHALSAGVAAHVRVLMGQ